MLAALLLPTSLSVPFAIDVNWKNEVCFIDAYFLLNKIELDWAALRKCFVVYAAFNKVDFSEVSDLGELKFDTQQFRQELMETLARGSVSESPQVYLEKLRSGCQDKLNAVLPFSHAELEFLTAVNKCGKIKPELLSDSADWHEKINTHPMLRWKVFNVRKHYGL